MVEAASISEFLAAWRAWDARPGSEDATRRLESVATFYANKLGVSSTAFRERMANLMRLEATYEEAVELLVSG